MRVLNTRPRHQLAEFTEILKAQGFEVFECPLLEIVPAPKLEESLMEFISGVKDGDWIFFTSQNAVRITLEQFNKWNKLSRLKTLQIAVVGEKTALKVRNYNLEPSFVSAGKNALEMVEEFINLYPQNSNSINPHIYFLRGEVAQDEVAERLQQARFAVSEITVYRSEFRVIPEDELESLSKLILENNLDLIFLTSSLSAQALVKLFPESQELLKIPVAVIGDRTALTAKTLGFQTIIASPRPTLEELAKIGSTFF